MACHADTQQSFTPLQMSVAYDLPVCAVFLSVGCTEHSDSESDFELQAVDRGLADLSDEPSETCVEDENDGDSCSCEKCTVDFFMFRLLGRLKG